MACVDPRLSRNACPVSGTLQELILGSKAFWESKSLNILYGISGEQVSAEKRALGSTWNGQPKINTKQRELKVWQLDGVNTGQYLNTLCTEMEKDG